MVVLNEEKNIRDALESVMWMNELIVVDAYSQDQTLKICREYTDHVYFRKWTGMPDQKNFAIEKGTSEWIFLLDADERASSELRQEIESILSYDDRNAPTGYFVPRKNYYYGKWVRWAGCYPDYQLRLFRKGTGWYGDVEVHPRFILDGEVGYLRGTLEHFTYPTVERHFRKQNAFTTRAAKERMKTKRSVYWFDLAFRPLFTFLKYFVARQGFRDGLHGLIVSVFASMYTFGKYAKLWETIHRRGKSPEC